MKIGERNHTYPSSLKRVYCRCGRRMTVVGLLYDENRCCYNCSVPFRSRVGSMVTLRDLTKTLFLRSIQLPAAENRLLIQRAAREMAVRPVPGTVIVPLCFAMAVVVSGYLFHSPSPWGSLSLVMLGSAIDRHLAISCLKKQEPALHPRWVKVFYSSCLGMAAVWGITTAVFVYTDFEGFPLLLILILSSGIGKGCMVNFCIWRALAMQYLLLSFVPDIFRRGRPKNYQKPTASWPELWPKSNRRGGTWKKPG